MKEKIIKNWPYMLLSLILAFALWFVVIQITAPQTDKTLKIPVEFENEEVISERGMVVDIVGDDYVTIKVTKERSVINNLSADDFSAVADFTKMYRDTQVPVTVTSLNSKVKSTDFELSEASIEVKLESLQTVTRVIEYELIGSPATGYVVNSVTTNPETVEITCPESMVPFIRTTKVYVEVTDMKDPTVVSAQLKLLDGNQVEIDVDSEKDISWNTNGIVECSVDIHQVQSIPVEVKVTDVNLVADGYKYAGYEVSSENLMLYGNKEQITKLASIKLPAISLKGATENIVKEMDIQSLLPDGISIYKDSTTVKVTLKIEKLEKKSFEILGSSIAISGLDPKLKAEIATEFVKVELEGLKADLEAFDKKNLTGTMDLSEVEIGENEVAPVITVNDTNLSVVSVENMIVNISEEATEEPTTDETQ